MHSCALVLLQYVIGRLALYEITVFASSIVQCPHFFTPHFFTDSLIQGRQKIDLQQICAAERSDVTDLAS